MTSVGSGTRRHPRTRSHSEAGSSTLPDDWIDGRHYPRTNSYHVPRLLQKIRNYSTSLEIVLMFPIYRLIRRFSFLFFSFRYTSHTFSATNGQQVQHRGSPPQRNPFRARPPSLEDELLTRYAYGKGNGNRENGNAHGATGGNGNAVGKLEATLRSM